MMQFALGRGVVACRPETGLRAFAKSHAKARKILSQISHAEVSYSHGTLRKPGPGFGPTGDHASSRARIAIIAMPLPLPKLPKTEAFRKRMSVANM